MVQKKILMPWQRVHTQYGIFDICWVDPSVGLDWNTAWAGHRNRMVGAAADFGVAMFFSSWLGAQASIELLEDQPAQIPQEWEDVVEVSTTIPQGVEPFWMTFAGESAGPLPIPAGTWRLRVSAQGRDVIPVAPSDDEEEPPPLDRYLIQLWPAPPAPEEILRQRSIQNPIA